MSDPIGTVSNIAGPAFSAGSWVFKKATPHWRAGRWIVTEAKRSRHKLHLKALRQVLSDGEVYRAIASADSAGLAAAQTALDALEVRNGNEVTTGYGEMLLTLCRRAYLGTSETGTSIAISNTDLRGEIASLRGELLTAGNPAAEFERNLLTLSPSLRQRARELRTRFPEPIERLVQALTSAADRGVLLEDWLVAPPLWFPSHPDVQGWMGEIALDIDARSAAVSWLDRAIENGVGSRGYFKVRRTWSVKSEDAEIVDYLADVSEEPLVQAILPNHDIPERIALAESWQPETEPQESTKLGLLTQLLGQDGRNDDVIRIGTEAWNEHSYASAGLNAVDALIRRSVGPGHREHSGDLAQALALAMEIRNERRGWSASTGRAVSLAMHAHVLLTNSETAWKLSQLPPEGEATPNEASDADVKNTAIVLLAERGSVAQARAILDDSYPLAVRLQVEAREAELLLDDERANELWSQAIDETEDLNEKASLCMRLGIRGVVHPWVGDLADLNPEIAEEIRLVAGLFAGDSLVEQRARELAATNSRVAHALIMFFGKRQRMADVAFVAERAAEQWNDPDDWLKTAQAQWQLGDGVNAVATAEKALLAGGPNWGDQMQAQGLIVEASFRSEAWHRAVLASEAMLRLQNDSASARWALVLARHFAGEEEESYAAWRDHPTPLEPTTPTEAAAWLNLYRQYGSSMAAAARAVEIAREFIADDQVRRLGPAAIMLAPHGEVKEDVDVGSLFDQLEAEYPQDHGFVRLEINTEDGAAILADLDKFLGARPDFTDLERSIMTGTLPIGAVSQFGPKMFAESLILRRRSPRFGGLLQGIDEIGFVTAAAGTSVVIDTTALLTLALLPADSGNLLAGVFSGLISTTQQLLDANASKESLSRFGGGSFVPSTSTEGPRFEASDEDEQRASQLHAQALVEWFRRTRRLSNPRQTSNPTLQIGDAAGPWSSALDYAAKENAYFWCDDAATRRIAIEGGAKAFGTAAVAEYLRNLAQHSPDFYDSLEALLIHDWLVGVPFREESYQLALQLDNSLPGGLGAALKNSGPENAEEKIALALRAISNIRETRPDALQEWARTVSDYVASIDSRQAIITNRSILLRNLLMQPWMSESLLPFVVAGVRASAGEEWTTTFETAMKGFYGYLVKQFGYPTASAFVLALVARLSDSDRGSAVAIVLAR